MQVILSFSHRYDLSQHVTVLPNVLQIVWININIGYFLLTSSMKTNLRKLQTTMFRQWQCLTREQNVVFESLLRLILIVQDSNVILRYFLPARLFHVIDCHTKHSTVPSLRVFKAITLNLTATIQRISNSAK